MPSLLKVFQTFWSQFSTFAIEKQPEKLNFQRFFYLKDTLWSILSMKLVHLLPENMYLNKVFWLYIDKNFWKHFCPLLPFLLYKNNLKNQFFRVVLNLRNPFVAIFNVTRAPTSRKYVVQQGLPTPIWLKIFQNFWSHSLVFALEATLNLNYHSLFISKRIVGVYFQRNVCTFLQKISIWNMRDFLKLIWETLAFLFGLLGFCLRKIT